MQMSWTNCVKNEQTKSQAGTSCIQQRKRLNELLTSCTGTALWNMSLKVRQKERWGRWCNQLLDDRMALRKREGTGNWKRKH